VIIRRMADAIRAQNWFTVIIEIFIVVIGIFLGLQVTEWNKSRLEGQQSKLFTQRLIADLQENAWDYQYQIEYYGDVLDNANLALSVLDGREEATDEALLIAAFRATQYTFFDVRRATFDELTSTGTLGLITDQALRLTAMRVYASSTFDLIDSGGATSKYREQFRMITPIDIQHVLTKKCGDRLVEPFEYDDLADTLDYPCETGLPKEAIAGAARAIRENPMMIKFLRLRAANLHSDLATLVGLDPEIYDGLKAIRDGKP